MFCFTEAEVDFLQKELGLAVKANSDIEFDDKTLLKVDEHCSSIEFGYGAGAFGESKEIKQKADLAYGIMCKVSHAVSEKYMMQ